MGFEAVEKAMMSPIGQAKAVPKAAPKAAPKAGWKELKAGLNKLNAFLLSQGSDSKKRSVSQCFQ